MSEIQPTPKSSLLWRIFISPDEARLRASWRLVSQTLLLFLIANCVSIPIILFLFLKGTIPANLNSLSIEILLPVQIVEAIIFTLSIFFARRFFDKRSFVSLGLKRDLNAGLDLIIGFFLSAAMMGLVYLIMFSAGWLQFEKFSWQVDSAPAILKGVLAYFLLFSLVGWREELFSRGYHLQTIASGLNLFWGILLSSAIFGLLHLGNPGASWAAAMGIFFGGLLFGFAYVRTGQLWLPMGLHLGWNFFEGVVFGFPVSGLDIYRLVQNQIHGPQIWTGGAFGPEAGLVIVPALLLGTLLIYFYTKVRIPRS